MKRLALDKSGYTHRAAQAWRVIRYEMTAGKPAVNLVEDHQAVLILPERGMASPADPGPLN